MNKFLAGTAGALLNTVIITLCVKIIYNELPNGVQTDIENKTSKIYKAIKRELNEVKRTEVI